MGRKSVQLVKTSQTLPSNLNDYKTQTELVKWATVHATKTHNGAKEWQEGSHKSWKCDEVPTIPDDETDVFARNIDDGALKIKTVQNGEKHFIVCTDLDTSRHFGPITQMGWEHFQSTDVNHSLHLMYVAREWKHPNGRTYTYGDAWNGENNKDTSGYFFTVRNIAPPEVLYRDSGYHLNKIWWNLRTTGGIGNSNVSAYVMIMNLRFGWGEGEPSTNHMILLPKIRPFSEVETLCF